MGISFAGSWRPCRRAVCCYQAPDQGNGEYSDRPYSGWKTGSFAQIHTGGDPLELLAVLFWGRWNMNAAIYCRFSEEDRNKDRFFPE